MSTYYAPTIGVASWTAANWATSSGQSTGSSGPPTSSDDVILDGPGGNVTILGSTSPVCRSLVCTAYTHTLTHGSGSTLSIGTSTAQASNQALIFTASMTYAVSDNTSAISFVSTYTTTTQSVNFLTKTTGNQSYIGNAAGTVSYTWANNVTGFNSSTTLTRIYKTTSATLVVGVHTSTNIKFQTLYVNATGGNSNAAATYELTQGGGIAPVVVPSVLENVRLYNGSGNFTINAAMPCLSFDATGYTNAISHSAYNLQIGGAAIINPNSGIALVLPANYTVSTDNSTISFASNYTGGVLTVNYNGTTIGNHTYSGNAAYQWLGNAVAKDTNTTITQTAGVLNTNGYKTSGFYGFIWSGSTACTFTPGSSFFSFTPSGTNTFWNCTNTNLTVSSNTAIALVTAPGGVIYTFAGAGLNWNGLSVYAGGATAYVTITGANTLRNIGAASLTGTGSCQFTLPSSATTTLTGTLVAQNGNSRYVYFSTASGGTLALPATTHNMYGYSYFSNVTVTGATAVNLSPIGYATCTGSSGNISAATANALTFYLDQVNGVDASNENPFGWWSVAYTGATGAIPTTGTTGTGGTSSSTAILTWVNPADWAIGYGTLWFYGKSASFTPSETMSFAGYGSCVISADLAYACWLTIQTGGTSARVKSGDTTRIAQSPAAVNIGTATWVAGAVGVAVANGGLGAAVNISSATNTNPIVVTTSSPHGLAIGDYVNITGNAGNANVNGFWQVANDANYSSTAFSPTWNGAYAIASGSGGGNGTVTKANSKVVTLNSARTLTITDCNLTWTSAGQVTASLTSPTNTDSKSGGQSGTFVCGSTPGAGTKQAYFATGTLNCGSYTKLTFWVKGVNVALNGSGWNLCLCSDTAGASVVDTFLIPATNTANKWIPVTVARNGGGTCGASIQSIALYATATPQNANIRLSNISVTNDLGVQSLISLATGSTNSGSQGGTEGWYPIQAIAGTVVVLDSFVPDTQSSAGYGYCGTSQSGTTYCRETTKTTIGTTYGCYANATTGTYLYPVTWSGGWNQSTNLQSAETFLDGWSNATTTATYAVYSNANYNTFDHMSFVRYGNGCSFYNPGTIISNSWAIENSGSSAIWFYPAANYCIAKNCFSIANNTVGFYSQGTLPITVTNLLCHGNNGIGFNTAGPAYVVSLDVRNNATYGIQNSVVGSNFLSIYSLANRTAGANITSAASGLIYFRNSYFGDATTLTALTNGNNAYICCWQYGQTANNHYVFTDGGQMNSTQAAGKRHTASGIAWQMTPQSTRLISGGNFYPLDMEIAQIAVSASTSVTISCWVMVDSLTAIVGQLLIKGGQLTGVNNGIVNGIPQDLVATCTSTSYQQLSLTFTPTQAGVISVTGRAYYVSGVSRVYFDDMSVSQS
jgi:hypothetical protein